ncbi:MAG TPA: tetratricopeptide repeat protein [Acidobacteriaceae bacterium]|jgi:tetratricopeptide (TPR) repeat protein|nr:tetratricopeptide repeat protein [Acidobacteriaceae bacterium]
MFWAPRLVVLALFVLTAGALAQQGATAKSPSVTDVRLLMAQGRTEEAQRELDALASVKPEPPGVERLRGIVEYQNNHMAEAEVAFGRAMTLDPSDLESTQMRGVALYRMGKPEEAIPLLEKAHAAEPIANADPDYVLGLCYISAKRYDDARRALARQYAFPPDSAAAWLVTARILLRQELTAPAAAAAQQAVQLDPHMPLSHRLLGEIDLANGDVQGALGELEKEVKVNPLDGETYDRMGDAYLRSGRYALAQQVLDRALLLEPNASGPYILLGKTLLEEKDPVTATMYLERAEKMDPSNSMTHMLLARAFAASGRKDDANREFQALQKLQGAAVPPSSNP